MTIKEKLELDADMLLDALTTFSMAQKNVDKP